MPGIKRKSAMAALLACTALLGSAMPSSAFSHHQPYSASTMGRGVAGQHDRFAAGVSAHHQHYGHAPYGASTMGRGIAGYHSRHY